MIAFPAYAALAGLGGFAIGLLIGLAVNLENSVRKKPYEKPTLISRGTLATLTQGGVLPGRKSHPRRGRSGPQYAGS